MTDARLETCTCNDHFVDLPGDGVVLRVHVQGYNSHGCCEE